MSFRDVEDLLAGRGVTVSYEAIRLWCRKFDPAYAHNLRRRQGRLGDVWYLDEVFIRIRGERCYLWRVVDHDGDVLDIPVTRRRDARAAKRFLRKLLQGQGRSPWQLVPGPTGKLCGRPQGPRAEGSPANRTVREQPGRGVPPAPPGRERHMRRFKSAGRAQRVLAVHAAIGNALMPSAGIPTCL